jgi:hypothetical protein
MFARAMTTRINWLTSFARKSSFTIFVDAMFTVVVARRFTKVFDRVRRDNLSACLSRACNAG